MMQAGGVLPATASDEAHVLQEILRRHLPKLAQETSANDREGTFPVTVFEALRRDGALAATVPHGYGGLGVSRLADVCDALRLVAATDASAALAIHMAWSRGLTCDHERRSADPSSRGSAERILDAMGNRHAVVGGAVSEAAPLFQGSGTTLEGDGRAEHMVLRGRKSFVTMAPFATHFIVTARPVCAASADRTARVFLPRDVAGVRVGEMWDGFGMRASGSVSVEFDRCPVDPRDVVFYDDTDLHAAAIGKTLASVCMLGISAGIAEAARDVAVAGLVGRGPVESASRRSLMASVEARLFALHATVTSVLAEAESIRAHGADLSGTPAAGSTAFACAKDVVTSLAVAIVDDCASLVGAGAYSARHPLARLFRDVRAGPIMQPFSRFDGRDFVARRVLGPTDRRDASS